MPKQRRVLAARRLALRGVDDHHRPAATVGHGTDLACCGEASTSAAAEPGGLGQADHGLHVEHGGRAQTCRLQRPDQGRGDHRITGGRHDRTASRSPTGARRFAERADSTRYVNAMPTAPTHPAASHRTGIAPTSVPDIRPCAIAIAHAT